MQSSRDKSATTAASVLISFAAARLAATCLVSCLSSPVDFKDGLQRSLFTSVETKRTLTSWISECWKWLEKVWLTRRMRDIWATWKEIIRQFLQSSSDPRHGSAKPSCFIYRSGKTSLLVYLGGRMRVHFYKDDTSWKVFGKEKKGDFCHLIFLLCQHQFRIQHFRILIPTLIIHDFMWSFLSLAFPFITIQNMSPAFWAPVKLPFL